MKLSHAKFEDVDFGPTENDEFGAVSFYGSSNSLPDPAGSKYPLPSSLKWERPLYADDKFNDHVVSGENKPSQDVEETVDAEDKVGDTPSKDDLETSIDDDDEFGIHSSADNDAEVV